MNNRTRLADVATHAGVSTATVSRVLNGKQGVAEPTRRAVVSALDMLGYERPIALRERAAGLVGLIVPELTNPVFPLFAQQIEQFLATSGYTTMLCTQSPGGTTEDTYVEMLLEHSVDGIVFVSGLHADTTSDASRYKRLVDEGIPFVVINGTNDSILVPSFSTDDAAAMRLAIRHLASQGHEQIGLATGPRRFVPVQRKIEGFRGAMQEYLGVSSAPIVSTLFTVEGGRSAGTQLIDSGCTAVVCASDLMALGAVLAARSRDLDVPADVSVIGYDDSTLVAFTDPPLTTVRQPVTAMAQAAVSTLLNIIVGRDEPVAELTFVPELVVRQSTGAVSPRELTGPEPAGLIDTPRPGQVLPTALT